MKATLALFLLLVGSVSAATFPLPTPTRPISFPLKRPVITGTVVAWGSNGSGQTNIQAGLRSVVAIAAGGHHTVALKEDGTVVAWGQNSSGQSEVPLGLGNVVSISAGDRHTVALKSDGTVVAWGGNEIGQLQVPANLSNVVVIAAGRQHTVAMKADGSVVAWGYSLGFEGGPPAGLSGLAIAAGVQHTVALQDAAAIVGKVAVWGGATRSPRPVVLAELSPSQRVLFTRRHSRQTGRSFLGVKEVSACLRA
jgi:hypothetical protein